MSSPRFSSPLHLRHIPADSPDRPTYLVGLGANLPSPTGSPAATIRKALELLGAQEGWSLVPSRFYRTPAFPAGSGPDYVNAAARVLAPVVPSEMLEILHGIEARFGRERQLRWESRCLDLDLLASGDAVLPDARELGYWMAMGLAEQSGSVPETLLLPHPRLHERGFVLVPLMDLAPDWRHPLLDRTVREMLAALPPGHLAGIELINEGDTPQQRPGSGNTQAGA